MPEPSASRVSEQAVTGAFDKFDLRGLDWLTQSQAAHYCCVSVGHFSANSHRFTQTRRFLGKKLYSKAELFDQIARSPLWSAPKVTASKQGAYAMWRGKTLEVRLQAVRLRPYKPRKKTTDSVPSAVELPRR